MDIKAEIAFQEAMEEVNDLNKRLIFERSIRKQLEQEKSQINTQIEDAKEKQKEIEAQKSEAMKSRMKG